MHWTVQMLIKAVYNWHWIHHIYAIVYLYLYLFACTPVVQWLLVRATLIPAYTASTTHLMLAKSCSSWWRWPWRWRWRWRWIYLQLCFISPPFHLPLYPIKCRLGILIFSFPTTFTSVTTHVSTLLLTPRQDNVARQGSCLWGWWSWWWWRCHAKLVLQTTICLLDLYLKLVWFVQL